MEVSCTNFWLRWFSRKKKWEQDVNEELRVHTEPQMVCRVLRIARDGHLLGAFWRHVQRHVRGLLRADDDVLAPIRKLPFRVRPQIVLPCIVAREFVMSAGVGVRGVRLQSI